MNIKAISFAKSFKCSMCAKCCQNWGVFVSEKVMNDVLQHKDKFPEFDSSKDFCSVVNNLNPVYHALITMDDGKCIFLNKGKCRIFKTFGKGNGNPLCICYPFLKLKLKNLYTIICTLSCSELKEYIFRNEDIFIDDIKDDNDYQNWPAIILNNSDSVCFSKISHTFLTWDAFYFLENSFINKQKLSFEQTIYKLAEVNKMFMREKNSTLDVEFVRKTIETIKDSDVTYSSSTENILFFLKRKINLYESTPFENVSKDFINNEDIFPSIKNGVAFRGALKEWDSVFKKLFIVKFYSNPSNFLVSVQFFWHVFLFYFSFLKVLLYARWSKNNRITKEDIIYAIDIIEMHFVHDSKIFQFWGNGRRGANDFSEQSLFNFII